MTQRKKLSHDKIAKWARSIVQELSSSFRNISLPIPKVFNCLSQSNLKFFQVIDQGAFSSVQFSLSHVRLFATPWTAAHQASLSITNPWSLLRLMPTKLVMPYSHLILCHPLLLPPSIIPSIKSFQMSQFFASGGQSIGVLASASALPMNIQGWFPLGLTGGSPWGSRILKSVL